MMAQRAQHGLTLGELIGQRAGAYAPLTLTDLTLDSRQVESGAAFVAVPGGSSHGLAHAAEARARGAAVVLYEPGSTHPAPPEPSVAVPNLKAELGTLASRFFGTAALRPAVTAVTGTNGKTTVAYLLAQALAQPDRPAGYIGTLGFGVPPDLTEHGLTTPDCLTLHREIAALKTARVALEVSSHALDQDRIAGLAIGTAVFTNLTRDHLDAHGDFDRYGNAKARLFKLPGLAHAVLNADDAFAAALASGLPTGCDLVRTSVRHAPIADLHANVRVNGLDGLTLEIGGRFGAGRLASRLIGDFNAENLLVALGAMLAQGTALAAATEVLSAAQGPPGRMDVQGGGRAPWVVVDYAHTPDALERVLATLERHAPGRITCIFGCGGDRDRGKRPLMGAVAARLADRIVLTDDNPRGEDGAAIVAAIRSGIPQDQPGVSVVHDRATAIHEAIAAAREGDVVLVAGKGHETVQIVGADARPFDDRAEAAAALGGRAW